MSVKRRIIACSLYYKKNLVTGANKRFDEIFKRLYCRDDTDLHLIVAEGHCPNWCKKDDCTEFKYTKGIFSRLILKKKLEVYFENCESSIVISDWIPVPYAGLSKHLHVQLIHDLRNFGPYARSYLWRLLAKYQAFQLKYSEFVLTVSETSRYEVAKYSGKKKENIIVSYNGVSLDYIAQEAEVLKKKKFDLLYIATFEKRKNHEQLLRALALLETKVKVLFVGADLGYKSRIEGLIRTLDLGDFVSIEEAVSENKLIDFYKQSRIFISTSQYEGFGMPLVEAMALGVPVCCSDIPVFRELCGSYADYFDPTDVEDIAKSIKRVLDCSDVSVIDGRENLILDQFGWCSIVEKLVNELDIKLGLKFHLK